MKRKENGNEMLFQNECGRLPRAFAGFMLGVVAFILLAAFCVCAGGCASRTAGEAVDVIARDSQLRGRLESTIESLDGTILDSVERLEAVIEDSRKIESGAKRLDFLFTCYEQEVYRLINEMRGASDRIKDSMENYLDSDKRSVGSDNGVRDSGLSGKEKDNRHALGDLK